MPRRCYDSIVNERVKPIAQRLHELGDDYVAVVDDHVLAQLLDPFRGRAPLRVVCARRGCGETVLWWGLPSAGEPLGLKPVLTTFPGGAVLPTVSPDDPDTQPRTGYVYGIGPWTVEGCRVVFAEHGMQHVPANIEPRQWMRDQPPAPYDRWVVPWLYVGENPVDADPKNRQLRLIFRCPTCGLSSTLTNTTMLKRLVRAIAEGEKRITI